MKPETEKEKIKGILSGQLILGLNDESAKIGGKIHGLLAKEGKTVCSIDCMIAGIALNKKERVLTRNAKNFSRIPNLETETY